MKIISYIVLLIAIVLSVYSLTARKTHENGDGKITNVNKISTMKLESSAFKNNKMIPAKYTCDGERINPPLSISGVPAEAKSLALIMDDPDAPSGTWVHWIVWNLPAGRQVFRLEEGSNPGGVSGKNSWGKTGYGAPCPPSGTHRYFFKLYAIDGVLGEDITTTKEDLLKMIEGHILEQTELIGLYKKV